MLGSPPSQGPPPAQGQASARHPAPVHPRWTVICSAPSVHSPAYPDPPPPAVAHPPLARPRPPRAYVHVVACVGSRREGIASQTTQHARARVFRCNHPDSCAGWDSLPFDLTVGGSTRYSDSALWRPHAAASGSGWHSLKSQATMAALPPGPQRRMRWMFIVVGQRQRGAAACPSLGRGHWDPAAGEKMASLRRGVVDAAVAECGTASA